MAKLKKNHFYYGAILDALFQYNPDASPVLMTHEDSRQVYKVMTNTSEECILFFKYASPKKFGKNEQDISYLFTFSDDDKKKLKVYMDKYNCPIFLYLLCKQSDLKESEIIVLKYEEYKNVEENRAITIRIQKNKNYILLFKKGSKARDNAYQIPRNRIEKTFDELADDYMKESANQTKKKLFYLEMRGCNATGIAGMGKQFVVKKGSKISTDTTPSFQSNYAILRDKLIEKGIIKNGNFVEDYAFKSVSAAASVVGGRSANGRREWSTIDGIPYSKIHVN